MESHGHLLESSTEALELGREGGRFLESVSISACPNSQSTGLNAGIMRPKHRFEIMHKVWPEFFILNPESAAPYSILDFGQAASLAH